MTLNTKWLWSSALAALTVAGAEPPQGFLLPQEAAVAAARAVTAERFPDADRVLVDDRVLTHYEKDGTSVTWDDEYAKILTEKGRREAAQFSTHFNAHYGTSFVFRAELVKPDGRVVPVDVEAYSKVSTESGQMSMNIYDPENKVLTCALPGLEVGDVCHVVSCHVQSKARVPDTWSDRELFEYTLPILKLDYEISAPPELPLSKRQLRMPVPDTVTYTGAAQPDGRTLHTWRVRDVPKIFPEPNMPPLETQVQRLNASTISDWRDVSRWYWKLCEPALAKTVPEMQETVDALIAGAATREEKIERVFKFVSQEIRYMGITTEDTAPGYEPHEVGLTFKNRYGVCRDKAALLAVMLTMAGIQGYPVLIHAGAKMDPDIPVPFFNHAITAVANPGGGYTLMDATDEHTRDLLPSYLGNRSYLVARPEGETLLVSPVPPAERNLVNITTDGSLDANGMLVLATRVTFEGINDNAYRGHFLRQKADQRRKFIEGLFKAHLPGAEVLECTISPKDLQETESLLEVSLTVRVPDFPVRGDGLDTLSLPWLGVSLGYVNFILGETGLDKRRYTLETGLACGVREQIRITLADSMGAPHVIPQPVTIERTGLTFALTQSLDGDTLSGSLTYLLTEPEFSPEAYLELKEAQKEIEAAWRRRPIFIARANEAQDQEILFTTADITLHTPTSWTTTSTWSKRILTYAGKKNGAEIKLPFNPVWQELELISATVSNLNGTVHSVTPKEINIMDAPWAGAAPRYPAGKIMVVTLPGVEEGSVINVSTRFTETQRPFFSRAKLFGGTSPVSNETFRLTFPRKMTPAVETFNSSGITFSAVTNSTSITWEWAMEKSPLIVSEELLPPWHFHQPAVYVSCGTWRDFSRTLGRAFDTASDGNRAARKHAKQLVKGVSGPYEKMRVIRDDVLRTIRPAGPSFLDFPLALLSTPDQTLADQYGHPADRALLMAEMLDAAGLDAEIVFAALDTTGYPAYSQPQRDIPQSGFFSQPLVRVRIKGQTYYLNEGDQYDEPGTSALHRAPYLTRNGKIETLDIPREFQDLTNNNISIDLDEQGTATITVWNAYWGTSAGPFRKQYKEMLPEDRRRHHLELVSRISKSAVAVGGDLYTDVDNYPGIRTYTVTAPNYAVIEGNTLSLLIPDVSGPVFPLRGDTRKNPLFFSANDQALQSCTICLPKGYTRLSLLPETKMWDLPNGLGSVWFHVATDTRPDGRREVTINRPLGLKSGEASAQLYPALLEYNRLLTHPSTRTLVAERDTP